VLDAVLGRASTTHPRKVIPLTIDVQTDHYFLSHSPSATVCTSFLTLRNSKTHSDHKTRRWRSSSNAPFVINTGLIQVIEGSNTDRTYMRKQWTQGYIV
jgi:hypothetical protein